MLLFGINALVAQSPVIDSLRSAMATVTTDSLKCDILKQIMEEEEDEEQRQKINTQIMLLCEKHLNENGTAVLPYAKHYISALLKQGEVYETDGKTDSAFYKYNLALKWSHKIRNEKKKSVILNTLGYLFQSKGDSPKALDYFQQALAICEKNEIEAGIPSTLNNMALVYSDLGDIPKSLEYYNKALLYREKLYKKDPSDSKKKSIANSLSNIATIYVKQGERIKAAEYFEKAIRIQREVGDKYGEATALSNLATLFDFVKEKKEALNMLTQALKLREELQDMEGVANSEGNIGVLYFENAEYDNARDHFLRALEIRTEIADKSGVSVTNNYLANVYLKKGDIVRAKSHAAGSLQVAKELGYPSDISEASYTLYEINQAAGNHREALTYYKEYIKMRDSTNNEQTKRATLRQQAKYEFQQLKAVEDVKHQAQIEKQMEIAGAERKRQNTIIAAVSVVLLLVLFFSYSLYKRFKLTEKQKRIIELKEKETQHQKHIIEEKHREITDSINYAERIQRSFLATRELLNEHLKEYFIFFKPKDVVSGDFYWASPLNNGSFAFVTADSTGHGVPGAIMSLLNITSLEKAIEQSSNPAEILNITRRTIIERLKKDGSADGGKDGMDCSFISFNKERTMLEIAAANNPVWIIRDNELIEVKADKMPVGKHDKETQPFELKEINVYKGDVVYALTDGFPDQFGGTKGKKFMAKRLKELLLTNHNLSMDEQRDVLEKIFKEWVGELEQVDDVCVIGVRL